MIRLTNIQTTLTATFIALISLFTLCAQTKATEDQENGNNAKALNGIWKLSIPALHRTPRLDLNQNGNSFAGTWHGLAGDFPLQGTLGTGGQFNFTVNFDSAPLAATKKIPKGKAIASFAGVLKGQVMSGVASFPQLDQRQVDWSGERAK